MCRVCSYIYFVWISVNLVFLKGDDDDYVPNSPCPDIFRYETHRGQWYGVIKRTSATYGADITLTLSLSVKAHVQHGNRGYVEIFGNTQHTRYHIYEGLPFYYKVIFPQVSHKPKVVEIAFNDDVVCRGEPEIREHGRHVTDYTLEYSFNAADDNWQNYNTRPHWTPWQQYQQPSPIVNYQTDSNTHYNTAADWQNHNTGPHWAPWQHHQQPSSVVNYLSDRNTRPEYTVFNVNAENADEAINRFLSTLPADGGSNLSGNTAPQENSDSDLTKTDQGELTVTMRLETATKQPETAANSPVSAVPSQINECGLVGDNTLFIKGEETSKGDWPWLVAIYVERPSSLDFRCAGTLVSNRHVITAAHCVRDQSNRPVAVNGFLIKVGVFNLQDWTDRDVKQVGLKNILQHPKYTGGSNHLDDISVLIFSDEIEFNTYIKPACLWNMDTDQEKIVGRSGTVVGWGRDEYGLVATPEPRQGKVPIVSTTTCRGSHADFARLTSENTICAGARDGTGPCNGDSGGGLYLNINNRWYLRGIVSVSIPGTDAPCNLNEYVVYTDAAKFMPWIRAIIKASS